MTTYALPDTLDISLAAATRERLSPLLTEECIELDGSQVERVDGCAIQLLVAFVQEARVRGLALRWVEASPALRRAAACLGLAEAMALPSE